MSTISDSFRFTQSQIMSVWAIAGACILIPLFYAAYFGFKRKLNLPSIIAGAIVGALCALVPNNANSVPVQAFWIAAEETAAMYICLRIVGNSHNSPAAARGLALGWVIVPIVAFTGITGALPMVSSMQIFNEEGLASITQNLSPLERDAFLESLSQVANTTPLTNVMLALKCAGAIAITIGSARLLWYSLKGERKPPHWCFIVIAALLRTAAELLNLRFSLSLLDSLAYFAAALVTLALSIAAARSRDNPDLLEDRLSRRKL
jgi:hypothetical protein